MAFTDIDNSELHFQTKTFSGNAGTNAITLDGSENMQPDWVWLKKRNGTANHHLVNSVAGAGRYLYSTLTNAEGGDGADGGGNDLLASFNSDGFTLDAGADSNASGATGVAWCWKAGGSASSNSDGSITSSVSANTDAGFSIASYTGTGSAATVGHGLGAKPQVIFTKSRDTSQNWLVQHKFTGSAGDGWTDSLVLNLQNAADDDSSYWNDTEPTSSVFSVGSSNLSNKSSDNMIAYCFAEKQGYSKFFFYDGSGNSDGTFVYLGFKPAWLMVKPIDASDNWVMFDNKRHNAINSSVSPYFFYANKNFAETTDTKLLDFVSNGFKVRSSGNTVNRTSTFIGMAFAEAPFVNSSGVPCNAR